MRPRGYAFPVPEKNRTAGNTPKSRPEASLLSVQNQEGGAGRSASEDAAAPLLGHLHPCCSRVITCKTVCQFFNLHPDLGHKNVSKPI